MTAIFVLDTGPLGQLAKRIATRGAPSSLSTRLVAVEHVWNAELPASMRLHVANIVVVRSIPAIGPVADIYTQRYRSRRNHTTRDVGEDASIAVCVRGLTEAVFVTEDKDGALIALFELGPGRVMSSCDLWAHLREQGEITTEDFDWLCTASAKKIGFRIPPARLGCS